MTTISDFDITTADGQTARLPQSKATLIVNTASKCGYTRHYAALQELYAKHASKGLLVVAFPCNQFGRQEPGTPQEIQEFVMTQYGVTFPVYNKVEVNGAGEHPLFAFLKSAPVGGDSSDDTDVHWNFTKWLCKDGVPIKRYEFKTDPSLIEGDIMQALQ